MIRTPSRADSDCQGLSLSAEHVLARTLGMHGRHGTEGWPGVCRKFKPLLGESSAVHLHHGVPRYTSGPFTGSSSTLTAARRRGRLLRRPSPQADLLCSVSDYLMTLTLRRVARIA